MNLQWRIDTVLGWVALIITMIICTTLTVRSLTPKVSKAADAFSTATAGLSANAEHETSMIEQLLALQARQTAVVEMEEENAKRIEALEHKMGAK